MRDHYRRARALGEKQFHRALTEGHYPYLQSLDHMMRQDSIAGEQALGVLEVPLALVVGTRTDGRQTAFSRGFMPLLDAGTEFAAKWTALYDVQVEEGYRDPVKIYEFMRRLYVQEGNKRVSVLRYLGAPTVTAEVTRLVPSTWDGRGSRLYGEFLEFWRVCPIYDVSFSREGSYLQLADLMGRDLVEVWPEGEVRKLQGAYHYFEGVWESCGGKHLDITCGDALLVYLSIYRGTPLLQTPSDVLAERIGTLWREFLADPVSSGSTHRGIAGTLKKVGETVAAPVAKAIGGMHKSQDDGVLS